MKPIFTKSSAESKLTEENSETFAKVVEKNYNNYTKTNRIHTDDFTVDFDENPIYATHNFSELLEMEKNYFCKASIKGKFHINASKHKNKVFLKCYTGKELVLEISMTDKQLQAVCDKYYVDLDYFMNSDVKSDRRYMFFYSGSFLYKDKSHSHLSTNLTNLRLLKVSNR